MSAEEPLDLLTLLLGVTRAEQYEKWCPNGTVDAYAIAEQLGETQRRVIGALRRAVSQDLVVRGNTKPYRYWVGPEGEELISEAVERGEVPELPESAQHRQWRINHEYMLRTGVPKDHAYALDLVEAARKALDAKTIEEYRELVPNMQRLEAALHNFGSALSRAGEPEPNDAPWERE